MAWYLIIINVGIEARVPGWIGILGIIQGRLADGQPVRHSEGIHEILAGTIGIPASILPQRIDPAFGPFYLLQRRIHRFWNGVIPVSMYNRSGFTLFYQHFFLPL